MTLPLHTPRAHRGPLHEKYPAAGEWEYMFLPFYPGMSLNGTALVPVGDTSGSAAVDVGSFHVIGIDSDAANEEACYNIFVPCNMDVSQPIKVYVLFTPDAAATGDSWTYAVTYAANVIHNYAVGTTSDTVLSEATTALNGTALAETVNTALLSETAVYYGAEGEISASTFSKPGIISLKLECTAVASGEGATAFGLLLFYKRSQF